MSRSGLLVSAAICALIVFAPLPVLGQCTAAGGPASCSLPGTVTMTAGRVIRLQLSGTSTTLTAPTLAHFEAGLNTTTGPTLTVSANAAWTLYVRSSTPLWGAVTTAPGAPARADKPAGDLRWSTSAGGPFVALSTTDASLLSGSATAAAASTLYFETLYSWALDTPGDYGLTLILSLTSP